MRLLHLLCAALGLALASGPGTAAKLEKPICDDLKVEHSLLQQKGLAGDLAKGPDWAKANLSRERLKEIERLIHVEEQLAFRCPQPKRIPAPGDDDDGATTAKGGKATAAKAAVPKAPKAQPKPAAGEASDAAAPARPAPARKVLNTAPQPAAPVAAKAADPAAAPAVKKAPAKPKPKTEDAYSPPPGSTERSVFQN